MGYGLDHGLPHVLSTPMNTKCVLPGNDAMNSSKDYSLFHNACKNAERLVNKRKMTGCLGALELELRFLHTISAIKSLQVKQRC